MTFEEALKKYKIPLIIVGILLVFLIGRKIFSGKKKKKKVKKEKTATRRPRRRRRTRLSRSFTKKRGRKGKKKKGKGKDEKKKRPRLTIDTVGDIVNKEVILARRKGVSDEDYPYTYEFNPFVDWLVRLEQMRDTDGDGVPDYKDNDDDDDGFTDEEELAAGFDPKDFRSHPKRRKTKPKSPQNILSQKQSEIKSTSIKPVITKSETKPSQTSKKIGFEQVDIEYKGLFGIVNSQDKIAIIAKKTETGQEIVLKRPGEMIEGTPYEVKDADEFKLKLIDLDTGKEKIIFVKVEETSSKRSGESSKKRRGKTATKKSKVSRSKKKTSTKRAKKKGKTLRFKVKSKKK